MNENLRRRLKTSLMAAAILLIAAFLLNRLTSRPSRPARAQQGQPALPASPSAAPFILTESSPVGEHRPARAFDGSTGADSFWETAGSYPFWLQIQFQSARTVVSYSLEGGELTSRMPTAWELQGSVDGADWLALDTRSDQGGWASGEARNFEVADPGRYGFYRFLFTAGMDAGLLRIYEVRLNCPDQPTDFAISPEGELIWTDRLRVNRSPDSASLPDLPDGRIRAKSGGTLVIQPQGDFRRGAIDMIPTSGKLPDVDALGEITLHRIIPSPDGGFEMMSLAALAGETPPFALIVESGGKGRRRPFVFWSLREDTAYTQVDYAEAFRITEDGAVQIGRKRGKGAVVNLLSDDPAINDQTPADSLFIERQDPAEPGLYDSDFFKIVAKSRDGQRTHRHEWRMNVHLDERTKRPRLLIQARTGDGPFTKTAAVTDRGDVELFEAGAGLIMRSTAGKRWRITVDDSGALRTVPVPLR